MHLRPLTLEDETKALAIHRAMLEQDGFPFLLDHEEGESWARYVARREANRRGTELPLGWVPGAFLVAVVDGEIVGRASIRFRLTEWLARFGGHIGYGVAPDLRRRGHATEILRHALVIARDEGIADVLVLCDVENVASARVIERCGGRFESVIRDPQTGTSRRRYWIS